jgi:probable phosphoglycerate mutase
MQTILLIRPGWTDFDEQNRLQGVLDLPLSPVGEQQVRSIVEELKQVELDVLYTGPNQPARRSAEMIAAGLGIRVRVRDGLRNLDFGLWQGLHLDEIRRKFPKVFRQWRESPETVRPPEGESVSEAIARVTKTLRRPLSKQASFAVVASEPLATVVGCVVHQSSPDFSQTFEPECRRALIEYLRPDDRESAGLRESPEVQVIIP